MGRGLPHSSRLSGLAGTRTVCLFAPSEPLGRGDRHALLPSGSIPFPQRWERSGLFCGGPHRGLLMFYMTSTRI